MGITAIAASLPAAGLAADAPQVVPLERWDVDCGITDARYGSFVADADLFDAASFSISRSSFISQLRSVCLAATA